MEFFLFPRWICFGVVVSEIGKEPHRIEVSSADPRNDLGHPDCEKTPARSSRQFAATSHLRFEFHKRSQLFIRVHNETFRRRDVRQQQRSFAR
jgi:hypothetical protein